LEEDLNAICFRIDSMKKILLLSTVILASNPAHAVIPNDGDIRFEILRNGEPFGEHIVSFEKDGNQTRVSIDIEMKYMLGPIALFRYEHRNEEIWQGDRLISMISQTYDDGDDYQVNARWANVLKADVNTDGAVSSFEAPSNLYTTSYWNPKMLKASQLLNSQKGIIEDVSVSKAGVEDIETAQGLVKAQRYKIDASLPLDVWYDAKTNEWVGLDFEVRGSQISYRRID